MMKLQEWVPKLKGKKILLLGDMVADVYVKGHISRVSREAPVLVLEHRGETIVPGGAANAVHNAAVLGGVVYAVGICGEDKTGEKLKELLTKDCQNVELFPSVNVKADEGRRQA